ncbi:MAG TPA: cation:proton antiporter [Dehalococcoidia bacterium]|nr:cation:proton antiporter [Dehalococcoidia bacterium]
MGSDTSFLMTLALVLVAARAAAAASGRLGLTGVFGKLTVGLLLGPAVLGLVHDGEPLSWIADLGVLLLMFLAGLETDLAGLRSASLASALTALGGVALPFAGGVGVGLGFGLDAGASLFLGTILTATSVSITAQTLNELGRLRSLEGSVILGAAVMDDVLGVLILSLVIGLEGGSDPAQALAGMAGFLALAMALGWWALPALGRRLRHVASETQVALALGLALTYAWLAERFGGLAPITGAYLAGVLVTRTDVRHAVSSAVAQMGYGFFIPIFFVSVGLHVRGGDLLAAPALAASLALVAVATKVAGAFAGAAAVLRDRTVALRIGAGMVSRGEVALVVAVTGLSHGLIDQTVFSSAIVMTVATTLVTPLLLRFSYRARSGGPAAAQTPAHASPVPAGVWSEPRL